MKIFGLDNKLAKSMFVLMIVLPFLIAWQVMVDLFYWVVDLF